MEKGGTPKDPEEIFEIQERIGEGWRSWDQVICRSSALSMILGKNVRKYKCFENEIKMWVYEEMIDGRKLTDIINTEHENVKYPDSNGSSESFTSRIFPVISSPRM